MRWARLGVAGCALFLCFVGGFGQVGRQQVRAVSEVRPSAPSQGREVAWRSDAEAVASPVPVFGSIGTVTAGTPALPAQVFGRRQDVFLAGGPITSLPCPAPPAGTLPCFFGEYLPDGKYYFQVTDPSGIELLSTDPVSERAVTVKGGVFFSYDGTTHSTDGRTILGSLAVGLMPFADAGSQKAAYVAWLTPAANFDGSVSAVDSVCGAGCFHGFHPELSRAFMFRVEDKSSCEPTFCVSGVKFADANGSGSRDSGETGLEGVEIRVANGGGVLLEGLTGPDGAFRICGLTDSDAYRVSEVVPSGYTATGPTDRDVSRYVFARGGAYIIQLCQADIAGLDFGNKLIPNAIGGFKFEDLNANGARDPGEPGLAGVTIVLTPAGGGTARTTVTDASGNFLFTDVAPGNYVLTEVVPAGFTETKPATDGIPVTLASGGTSLNNVFGNFHGILTGTISGLKFNDANGNGTQDAGEGGLPGVTITLSGGSITPRTLATAADGSFSFTGVPFGTYALTETVPAGFSQTAPPPPGTISATLDFAHQTIANLAFGNRSLPATISGSKFNDANGNAVRDAGEPGLSGVTIQLKPSSGPTLTATTDASGNFSFTGLAPGTYTLSEVVPAGFVQTAPAAPGTFSVTVAAGQNASGFLFGNRAAAVGGSISGTKFNDANGNGVRDAGEGGQSGVTIQLKPSSGPTLTATTDASGAFSFTGLAAGTYVLSEVIPAGFVQTAPPPPGTISVTLTVGQIATGFLFGNQAVAAGTGSISGLKVLDIDADGKFNGIDRPLEGIVMVLTDSHGVIRQTTSGADGTFSFVNLPAGQLRPHGSHSARLRPDLPRDAGLPQGLHDHAGAGAERHRLPLPEQVLEGGEPSARRLDDGEKNSCSGSRDCCSWAPRPRGRSPSEVRDRVDPPAPLAGETYIGPHIGYSFIGKFEKIYCPCNTDQNDFLFPGLRVGHFFTDHVAIEATGQYLPSRLQPDPRILGARRSARLYDFTPIDSRLEHLPGPRRRHRAPPLFCQRADLPRPETAPLAYLAAGSEYRFGKLVGMRLELKGQYNFHSHFNETVDVGGPFTIGSRPRAIWTSSRRSACSSISAAGPRRPSWRSPPAPPPPPLRRLRARPAAPKEPERPPRRRSRRRRRLPPRQSATRLTSITASRGSPTSPRRSSTPSRCACATTRTRPSRSSATRTRARARARRRSPASERRTSSST